MKTRASIDPAGCEKAIENWCRVCRSMGYLKSYKASNAKPETGLSDALEDALICMEYWEKQARIELSEWNRLIP